MKNGMFLGIVGVVLIALATGLELWVGFLFVAAALVSFWIEYFEGR